MAAILGKKLGMTQVFREDGTVVPVTVIEAGPCKVTAIRDSERDGYAAVQLAYGEVAEGRLSKAEEGHLKKAGAPPRSYVLCGCLAAWAAKGAGLGPPPLGRYSMISETTPEPTVRPPSRIANRRPWSIAIG